MRIRDSRGNRDSANTDKIRYAGCSFGLTEGKGSSRSSRSRRSSRSKRSRRSKISRRSSKSRKSRSSSSTAKTTYIRHYVQKLKAHIFINESVVLKIQTLRPRIFIINFKYFFCKFVNLKVTQGTLRLQNKKKKHRLQQKGIIFFIKKNADCWEKSTGFCAYMEKHLSLSYCR